MSFNSKSYGLVGRKKLLRLAGVELDQMVNFYFPEREIAEYITFLLNLLPSHSEQLLPSNNIADH